MFIISQIFSGIGSFINIISMQMRKKKSILMCFMLGGTFVGIGFLFLEAYSGAVVCFIGSIETIINYLYDRKNKKLPIIFIPIYMLAFIISGIFTVKNIIGIMPIMANIIYVVTIFQRKESNIRKLNIFLAVLWGIYSGITRAYPVMIADILILISTIIGIVKYDVLKKGEKVKM